MKTICRGVTAILAGVLLVALAGSSRPSARVQAPNEDVRGLWVLRSSLSSPQRIAEMVRTAVDGGYNTLLVQVRGRGDAYYRSDLEPRAVELATQPATFDPLALTLTRAHAAGLKVHAWFNVNLVAGATTLPRSNAHIISREPGWVMVPRQLAATLAPLNPRSPAYLTQLARWTRAESDTVEGLFLSPILDAAQDYTVSIVRDLVTRYALDGLHLDYIRYPTADFDYSAAAMTAFRTHQSALTGADERVRIDGLLRQDPLAWPRAFPEEWDAFRRERLTTLVGRLRSTVKSARPQAVVSAAVVPVASDARQFKLQDWSEWARAGVIDVVCPMAYATTVAEFSRQISDATTGAHGRPVWAGIGAWRLPVARTADHIRAARLGDVQGVLLFSYDSLLTSLSPRGRYFRQLRPALMAVNDEP